MMTTDTYLLIELIQKIEQMQIKIKESQNHVIQLAKELEDDNANTENK